MQVSPKSRGRAKPSGSRIEIFIWYFMRVSGVALFVLALAHFSILHFVYDPANQTSDFILSQRWSQVFWRVNDWCLLTLVVLHSTFGVRTVVNDYIHAPRGRVITLSVLYFLTLLLLAGGTVAVMTARAPGA